MYLGPEYVRSGFSPKRGPSLTIRKGILSILISASGFLRARAGEIKNMSIISHFPSYFIVPNPFRAGLAARFLIYPAVDSGVSLKSPIATMFPCPVASKESVASPSLAMAASLLHAEFSPYFDG